MRLVATIPCSEKPTGNPRLLLDSAALLLGSAVLLLGSAVLFTGACTLNPSGPPAGDVTRALREGDRVPAARSARLNRYLTAFLQGRRQRHGRVQGLGRNAAVLLGKSRGFYLIHRNAKGLWCRRFEHVFSRSIETHQQGASEHVAHRFRYRIFADQILLTPRPPVLWITEFYPVSIPASWRLDTLLSSKSKPDMLSYRIHRVTPSGITLSGGTWYFRKQHCLRALARRGAAPFDLRGHRLKVRYRRPWVAARHRDTLLGAMRRRRRIYWAVRHRDDGLRCQTWHFTHGSNPRDGHLWRALKGRNRIRYSYYYEDSVINLFGPYFEYWENGIKTYMFIACAETLVIHKMGPQRIWLDQSKDGSGVWYLNRRACQKAVSHTNRLRVQKTHPKASRRNAARPRLSPGGRVPGP